MGKPVVIMPAGTRFGRLVVVDRAPNIGTHAAWRCQCDCGAMKDLRGSNLRNGDTLSCGCLQQGQIDDATYRYETPEWKALKNAIERTRNRKHKSFEDYGGRGIRVCQRWLDSFDAFFADMGHRPSSKHTLDRYPDQNGDYEPGNCRWATWTEQANNKRNNLVLTINGRTMTAPEWAREAGISSGCLRQRISRGIPLDRILEPSDRTRHLTAQGREDAAYGPA